MLAIRFENEIKIINGFLFKDSIKEIAGRRYDAETKAWYVPCTDSNVALLRMLGAEFREGLDIQRDAGTAIADEPPVVVMPIKATPYRHQIAAFNFALRVLGGAV